MKLNKNKKAVNFKKIAFDFAKHALLFAIAFIIEQSVGHLLVGMDSSVLEFALNELSNMVAIKIFYKIFLLANSLRAKNKDGK